MNAPRTGLLIVSLALAPWLTKSGPARYASGEIVTLYARDDLLSSFDFRSGSAGGQLHGGEVQLTGAQIAYDVFVANFLSIGFDRDERVEVLDLGDVAIPPSARAHDRSAELDASIFHTLFLTDEGFAYVGPGGNVEPFERADRILSGIPPQGVRHFEPVVGHTYLLRVRRNDTSTDELFKFQVIGLLPGHSLTMRWAAL